MQMSSLCLIRVVKMCFGKAVWTEQLDDPPKAVLSLGTGEESVPQDPCEPRGSLQTPTGDCLEAWRLVQQSFQSGTRCRGLSARGLPQAQGFPTSQAAEAAGAETASSLGSPICGETACCSHVGLRVNGWNLTAVTDFWGRLVPALPWISLFHVECQGVPAENYPVTLILGFHAK